MRVIAGEFKGLSLVAPVGEIARPTTDRVKESMFNLMGPFWTGGVAIDLFAGSGALGIEAVSRGASRAVFVDTHPRSIAAIRDNVDRCNHARRQRLDNQNVETDSIGTIWRQDWKAAWGNVVEERMEVGWVFLDPPYAQNTWPAALKAIAESALPILHGVVCEHPKSMNLPEAVGRLQRTKSKTYGDISVTLFTAVEDGLHFV